MKKLLGSIAIIINMTFGNVAHAGIPVIDVANLAQAVQQVASWAQQLQQMTAQLQQMRDTFNSLNGVRGMANLVNDPNARKYLPDEWQQTMNLMSGNSGRYGGISGSVAQIKDAAKLIELADSGLDPNSDAGRAFEGSQNQAALNRAIGEEGYKQASQRIDDIQALLNKVNSAPDQKDVLDLQARIQAEQAMLQNEQIKLALMTQLQQSQRDIAYQQAAEMRMKATKGDVPRF